MKPPRLLIVTLFIVILSASFASVRAAAISATGQSVWTDTPTPGGLVDVTLNFQSGSSSDLYLYRIGVHADWQASGYYYSKDLSSEPQLVKANGLYSVTLPISIPVEATIGQHTLIISADGHTANGDVFYWDSSLQYFNVVSSLSVNPTPTITASPTATVTITPVPTPVETIAPTLTPMPTALMITPTPTPIATETATPTLIPTPTTMAVTPTSTSLAVNGNSQETTTDLPILTFIIILAVIAFVAIVAIVAIIKR